MVRALYCATVIRPDIKIPYGWETPYVRVLGVIPEDASAEQVEDLRRAFYCGADLIFHVVTKGLSAGPEPQPDDIEKLDDLHAELTAFRVAVGMDPL